MITQFLILSILLGITNAVNVREIQADASQLINTSDYNYALTSPSIASGWKTVSVNNNNVLIYSSSCQVTSKTLDSLTAQERSQLESIKTQLSSLETIDSQSVNRLIVALYSGSNSRSSRGRNVNLSSFNFNGLSLSKYGDAGFSAAKPGMPNNLARISVSQDTATFVYQDGSVQMKPSTCLTGDEQQLIQQIRGQLTQAEQAFQQNMQNMKEKLQNMFGNGFLSNSMQQANNYQHQFQGFMPMNMFQQQQGYPSNNMGWGSGYGNSFAPGYYQQQQQQTQSPFGNNFPFGPNNSPFGPGFPFNG